MWASSSTSASCGRRGDQRVEVHLAEHLVVVFQPLARQDFKAFQQRLGLGAAVGFDHADDNIDSRFELGMRALQHFIGLADAGGGADEDLQPAGLIVLATRRLQQRIRRGSLIGVEALICHKAL